MLSCNFLIILNTNKAYHKFLDHFNASYTKRILVEAIDLLVNLWPYLVLGIIFTSLIKMFLPKEQVAKFFQKRKNSPIIIASLIGVISPLGSYVVIPLAAALFILGTPLSAVMALLVSSPLIDPNLFLLTAGAFGYEMALMRLISAFLIGLMAGYLTLWLSKINFINLEKVILKKNNLNIYENNKESKPFLTNFSIELYKMSKYISKYFFLAVIIAAAIKILTPPNLLFRLFNGNSFLTVLISTAAGVPFYVCGGAAIPVVQQLAGLGMGKGAVLSFFISGPVTKISNLLLMQSAFSTRIFFLYIFIGIFGAFMFGLLYNFI